MQISANESNKPNNQVQLFKRVESNNPNKSIKSIQSIMKFSSNEKKQSERIESTNNQVQSTNPIQLIKHIQPIIAQQPSIIIILRGHVRNSFDDNKLYEYLLYLNNKYKLYIFIHTWNIKSNNISWREVEENKSTINEDIIIKYFKNITIQKILIDDEQNVKLSGNVVGLIKTTLMPIKGWKNMWYGIYKIINYILNNINEYNLDANSYALNLRFDYFINSTINQFNVNDLDVLYNFESNNISFLKNKVGECNMYGVDNIYFGKIYKMYYTANLFNSSLDYIIDCFDDIHAQERLVYNLQKYINIYCDDFICDNDYINLTIQFILAKLKIDYIKSEYKPTECYLHP